MAINPVSGPPGNPSVPPATTPPAKPPNPPSLPALQALEGSTTDPLLVDPLTASANGQSTSGGGSSLLDSFNNMTGGDPLVSDLDSLDNATLGVNGADPAAREDVALNQELTSFLVQQATSVYSASQLLGGGNTSSGSLGKTTA